MPNIIAYAALLLWPFVIVMMFRKLSPEKAFIWSILGGYMALPQLTEFNFPMIPAFDKETIPNLTAFVICVGMLHMRFALLPKFWLGKLAMILLLVAPVLSVFTNSDPILFSTTQVGRLTIIEEIVAPVPGMRMYDAIAALSGSLLTLLPFFMARHILASEEGLHELIRALMIAGLIYSVPMLWEVRFSPQLHTNIYGFFQHDFGQMMRSGGFRPIVFMQHGLWVALFAATAAIAALHFALQAPAAERPRAYLVVAYLVVVTFLCRSLGPFLIMLTLAAMLFLLNRRMHLRVATLMGMVALVFPLLRGAGIIPTARIIEFLEETRPERAQSLGFRFEHEDILLERASQKPWFGWGGWGRNLERNPDTGEILSVADGQWVITIGQFGWVGYLGTFGLLALPLFALWWQYRRVPTVQIPPQVAVLALLLGANLIDLLPNATLVSITWIMAGALLGHAELQQARNHAAKRDKALVGLSRNGLLSAAILPTPRQDTTHHLFRQNHR